MVGISILVYNHLQTEMAELIGKIIPASSTARSSGLVRNLCNRWEGHWDHTYVLSSRGQRWGCFGRSQGGEEICRGPGDSSLADCLACDDSRAGIIYMVTGVCHQAANRILNPANIIVSKARGYPYSSSLFGDYGIGPWPQYQTCLRDQHETPSYVSGPSGLEEAPSAYIIDVVGLGEYSPMPPLTGKFRDDPRQQAFRKAIDERLGLDYDLGKRRGLLHAQSESFSDQDKLIESFQKGRLSADSYFAELTLLTRKCFSKYEKILSKDDFVKLFDFQPGEIPPPGDPELFAKAHGLSEPPKFSD